VGPFGYTGSGSALAGFHPGSGFPDRSVLPAGHQKTLSLHTGQGGRYHFEKTVWRMVDMEEKPTSRCIIPLPQWDDTGA
jgi:hypothetical protein